MTNVTRGKKTLAIVVVACVCAALIVTPAFGLYYVHSEDNVDASESKGAQEVCVTIDASAIGEGVTVALIFIPEDGTVADCLDEAIESSNSQNGLDAIHDYSYTSLREYLSDKTWTCTVYEAGSQNPGTQTTYDTEGTEATEDTVLGRYDSVVFTVEE